MYLAVSVFMWATVSAQTPVLTTQELLKLRDAAATRADKKVLHPRVAALFGMSNSTPVRHLRAFRFPFDPRGFSSVTFSLNSDDVLLVERLPLDANTTQITIYRTEANRTLRAAAIGSGDLSDLHRISNEDARSGFDASLRAWAEIVRMDADLYQVR